MGGQFARVGVFSPCTCFTVVESGSMVFNARVHVHVYLCVDVSETDVVAVDINSLEILSHWKAAHNCISMLRTQTLPSGQTMLGVADLHSGIAVYDLCATSDDGSGSGQPFSCLYHVHVDEVRHFELVGACVAVFHRNEPNVSFWNVLEQRTILCINVQEQARQLSEEFIVDNEQDADGTRAPQAYPRFYSGRVGWIQDFSKRGLARGGLGWGWKSLVGVQRQIPGKWLVG